MKLLTRGLLPVLCLGLVSATALPALAHDPASHATPQLAALSAKAVDTQLALRDLWVGHAFWIRNVVVAGLAHDAAARQNAEVQVVVNAKAIAAAFEPIYGKAASDKLLGLLAGHWTGVKNYFDASLAKNSAKQGAAMEEMTKNATAIAVFLSGANPNLPKDAVEGLLLAHISHHVAQIQELQDHKYADEAKTWALMKDHMYVIADALTGAVAKQFPDKF
ncbi:MAG: hypothetical protein ABI439_00410 [Rhodospirillales bacterium]